MSVIEVNPVDMALRPSHAGLRATVTGAGRGIGLYHRPGVCCVCATWSCRRDAGRRRWCCRRDQGHRAWRCVASRARRLDYAAVERGLRRRLGRWAVLSVTVINNAGISPKHNGVAHKVWEMSPAEWQQVVAVNLNGPFLTDPRADPLHAGSQARLDREHQSFVAGKTYSPIVACHYAATKSALIGFTNILPQSLVHMACASTRWRPAASRRLWSVVSRAW